MEGASFFADAILTADLCGDAPREPREVQLVPLVRNRKQLTSSNDEGENRLIQDFGPGRRVHEAKDTDEAGAAGWGAGCFDPSLKNLHRYDAAVGDRGRRVVFDPTEMARLLQPSGSGIDSLWRMEELIETTLERGTSGGETLLILKAVTDAFFVASRAVDNNSARVWSNGGAFSGDNERDLLVPALRQAWGHAVGQRNGSPNEWHSSVDLHVTAAWFQAWEAAYQVEDVLPADWTWYVAVEQQGNENRRSPHIEGELKLEAIEELPLELPPENWSLDDVKRSLLLVSDESWFREGQAMVDLRLFGPTRVSTFRAVFFDVPGAIDGCLKDRAGAALIPPTFRMYTAGDILDAFGNDAVVRSRDIASGETSRGAALEEVEGSGSDDSSSAASDTSGTATAGPRREVSIAEIQITWVDGYTHVLGWLDSNAVS
ncbi:unnamed protein product [Ectocarpus sp. 13 AM-2016]